MMDLSQKSDEELSRAIAEHIEPKPSEDFRGGTFANDVQSSPLKMWHRWIRGMDKSLNLKWQLRIDAVKGSAMTVMLLEKLPPGHVIDIEDDGTVTIFRYEDVVPCGEGRLGRAVAETYAKAHRLFEGEL